MAARNAQNPWPYCLPFISGPGWRHQRQQIWSAPTRPPQRGCRAGEPGCRRFSRTSKRLVRDSGLMKIAQRFSAGVQRVNSPESAVADE